MEETGLSIEPVGLAGFREAIGRDGDDRVERHFVILCFAARWTGGEPVLNEELSEAHWLRPDELTGLTTTARARRDRGGGVRAAAAGGLSPPDELRTRLFSVSLDHDNTPSAACDLRHANICPALP